ncbi:MAG: hypothetical protein PHE89_01625 [Alphaproteobacteria bacterium]|nr:hypothetical protein [Alphaproteobacteria bacterium]
MATKKPNKADLMTYKALQKAVEENKLKIFVNDIILNKPGIAVYNPWENLLPKLLPVLIGFFVLFFSVILGLIIIIGSLALNERICKKKLNIRFYNRTKEYVLKSYDTYDEIWQLGGLILADSENKKNSCLSPEENWKEYIIHNFSELMIDKKEEKPEEKVEDKKENEQKSIRRPRR